MSLLAVLGLKQKIRNRHIDALLTGSNYILGSDKSQDIKVEEFMGQMAESSMLTIEIPDLDQELKPSMLSLLPLSPIYLHVAACITKILNIQV
jgi:hypothetical protein